MSTFQVYKYGYVERFMFHDWYDVGPLSADGRARRSPQPPPDHHAQLRADPKGGPRTELPGRAARALADRNGRPLHGTIETGPSGAEERSPAEAAEPPAVLMRRLPVGAG